MTVEQMAQSILAKVAEDDMECETPGEKIRSKGQGRGAAAGRGRGPQGIPIRAKGVLEEAAEKKEAGIGSAVRGAVKAVKSNVKDIPRHFNRGVQGVSGAGGTGAATAAGRAAASTGKAVRRGGQWVAEHPYATGAIGAGATGLGVAGGTLAARNSDQRKKAASAIADYVLRGK